MSTEEEKVKADIDTAHAALTADLVKAGGYVRIHLVWIAGGIGVLLGFILGRIV